MHGSSVVSALASDAKYPEFEHGLPGSGVGISVSKHAPLMSFARMTLKSVLISGFR